MTKTIKGVGTIKGLSRMFPQYSLPTIYKSFVWSDLDYGDVLYDQQKNESLCQKLKVFSTLLYLLSPVPSRVHLK